MAVVEVQEILYSIENRLKIKWDKIREGKLKKHDDDRVYVVDGRERSGKSVFTIQQAAYIDPSIVSPEEIAKGLPRICFSPEEILNAIRTTESTQDQTKVIIFDEAFRGLSSRAAISKINKQIIQGLMEMGQKNLVLFIVLPSFFMLDIYPAVLRSSALFHIFKDKKNKNLRGFKAYNYAKKAKLYDHGIKKGWEYKIPTYFKGRFSGKYPGGDPFEQAYRDKKRKSLETMDITKPTEKEEGRISLERKIFLANLAEILSTDKNLTQQEIVTILSTINVSMTRENLAMVLGEVRKKGLICKM